MDKRKQIVIVGGGIAALEVAIGLHESPNVDVDVTLITPQRDFYYRPFAVLEPFGFPRPTRMSIAELLVGSDVQIVHDKASRVDLASNRVVLAAGGLVDFDSLVVTTGAKPVGWLPGAITIASADGNDRIQHLLSEIDFGSVGSVAFVAPPAASWTLPVYEFSLLTAARAERQLPPELRVMIVTPEPKPLAVFGDETSMQIRRMLTKAKIEIRTSTTVHAFNDGVLSIGAGREIAVDRAVVMPELVGQRIPGLPNDKNGFLPIDGHGLVAGTANVYAAGDISDFPVKQGSIAAQQADIVIAALAARYGELQDPPVFHPELHAIMFSQNGRTFLSGPEHGGPNHDATATAEPLWEDAEKIFSRHLSSRMQRVRANELRMVTP